eukprot:CAMPEP_0177767592 /NCGR_PEP_ID=MMETSP0491_2-20121128/9209_1 /TAXON_ID=63592 /ORGANISM="Tetraselmis chuii, Strain PLY429" /LENGTH=280 /DNA_ID=CAMNT_0019284221 /DNA_START=136 /DNA_END=978 /DNA_ORIENTATION=+
MAGAAAFVSVSAPACRHHRVFIAARRKSTRTRTCCFSVRAVDSPQQQAEPLVERSVRAAVSRRALLGIGAVLTAWQPTTSRQGAAFAQQVSAPGDEEGQVDLLPKSAAAELSLSEKQVLEYNKRIQTQNRVPLEFPWFVREGFNVKILADGFSVSPEGLVTKTFQEGAGETPTDGQKVLFHYTAYNESGSPIDSSYKQGRPAEMRIGASGMIPGFELGLRQMAVGTKMRVILPPALGPPVGPSTFFSAKQCEVFDVEVLALKNCSRKQFGMVSNIVCDDV